MSDEPKIIVKSDSYSVKTTSDITERIQELTKKTGLNHKDLFAAMVTRYYTELESGSDLDRSDDMQQIRYHLNRAENIFLGSLQKVQDLKEDYGARLTEQKNKYQEKQEELLKKISELSKEAEKLGSLRSKTEKELNELKDRNQELEKTHQNDQITIDLLSQKIKALESKASAAETLEAEIKNFKDKAVSDQQILAHLHKELEKAQQTITTQEQKEIELKETAHTQCQELQTAHQKEIQQLKDVQKLEADKMLLESERRILDTVQKVKDEYQSKIDALLLKIEELRLKAQEYTKKIFSLEMERLKQEKALEPEIQKNVESNNSHS